MHTMPETGNARTVLVWDWPVRLFHWALVALVPALYLTWRWNWMEWHALAGDALLTLLLFRVLWGFFGSDTARFARFLASPTVALRYLAHLSGGESDIHAGHNPAGGWMVAAMLTLLLAQTLTGLYVQNDVANEGPLTELIPAGIANAITALHAILWNVILVLVALHLLAILAYAVMLRQDLVRPMLTGRELLPASVPVPRIAGSAVALLLLGSAAGAAALIALMI
ncbi:MAG: cytochrome b/b6 domain-containing protein [Methylovirgula sp.]